MQRTRLSTLVEITGDRVNDIFSNPWRRSSLTLISFLTGMVMGTALPTSTGQAALWDVIVAALMFLFCEAIAIWYYRFHRTSKNSLIKLNLNAFRIGLTYSLFVEAVKLAT